MEIKNLIKRIIPSKIYLKIRYKKIFKRNLDFKNPKTFNEKLNWLKIYDKNDYTNMVDKYEVKKIIADKIGEQYIIPNYGVWNKFDDIEFEKLPKSFVLKCTHDSGGIVIVKDKEKMNYDEAKKKINKCLKKNYYYESREKTYKNVKPRIIAEKYMEDKKTKELRDYKFFCFDGKVEFMYVASNRQGEGKTYFNLFTKDFKEIDVINGHPRAPYKIDKPEKYDKMIELSEKIAKGMKHVRIDWYEVDGAVYFGEMTFYHNGGFIPFIPDKYDYEFGKYLNL